MRARSSIRLFLAAVAGVVLATMAIGAIANAQAPITPRTSTTCAGTLTLTPSIVFPSAFSPGTEIMIAASGLEPGAAYTIFVGGAPYASATTSNAGTTSGSVFVRPVAPTIEVQVATTNTCASATLSFAVPAATVCVPVVTVTPFGPVTTFSCPFVASPTVLIPVATAPGFCVLPGRPVLVPC
jgi:hypothetical protein